MEILLYTGLVLFAIFFSIQLMYMFLSVKLSKHDQKIRKDIPQQKMTILVPAYNEAMVLKSCLDGFRNLDYENYQLIIINDGSKDDSIDLLKQLLHLKECELPAMNKLVYESVKATYCSAMYPHINVIDKVNGGKADALNAGADHSAGDIIITLDADSVLEKSALIHINEAMQDPLVIATGGMVHVGQMYKKGKPKFKGLGLVKYQLSDYMMSFYVKRLVQSKYGLMSVVSGAFGAFRSYAMFEVGGYKKTIGEDMEITLNFQRLIHQKYKNCTMLFVPKAQCYTEVPADFKNLSKQRVRWQKGFLDSLKIYNKQKIHNLGWKLVMFMILDALLPGSVGIITTFLLVISVFTGNLVGLTLVLLIMTAVLQISLRLTSYRIAVRYGHRYSVIDYAKIFIFSIFEYPTYRMLDTYYFLYGTIAYFLQKNHAWNKVDRTGLVSIYPEDAISKIPMLVEVSTAIALESVQEPESLKKLDL
ncbi:glycosyltransferase family 2 protein [Planomicrobium chinense]|nr:glycosyltransferase family 2 protein [Planococcus chinensis]